MSTKIYDAYRVKKSVDFRKLLDKMKQISADTMAADADYLYLIHAYGIIKADEAVRKSASRSRQAEAALNENAEGKFASSSLEWIAKCLKDASERMEQDLISIDFSMSIWFDDEYWYIKFFVNWGVPQGMMNAISAACPELEDFHYQNQSDPPEDVPEDEYSARESKWDELTAPDGNYKNMLQFSLFDHDIFKDLVRRYWWRGEENLYKHLAYKFDKKIELKKDEDKTESA